MLIFNAWSGKETGLRRWRIPLNPELTLKEDLVLEDLSYLSKIGYRGLDLYIPQTLNL